MKEIFKDIIQIGLKGTTHNINNITQSLLTYEIEGNRSLTGLQPRHHHFPNTLLSRTLPVCDAGGGRKHRNGTCEMDVELRNKEAKLDSTKEQEHHSLPLGYYL